MDDPSRTGKLRFSILALVAVLSAGCGDSKPTPISSSEPQQAEFPVIVTAANGEVAIPRRPARIVSLSPTATETLYAIGAASQVVAVDAESSFPSSAPRTELSGFDPNIEALATYRPDLVVYSIEPGDLAKSLEAIGVPGLLQPAAANLDDAYSQIVELGTATGRQPAAERLAARMKSRIDLTVESLPRFPRPPTYYHELDEKYFTATSGTFVGELYRLLGLDNIADPADQLGNGYPQLSGEFIIQADPDLIFLADARCCGQSAKTLAARPGWEQIDAVQNGGVIELDDDIASRWGPRIVDFVESVAKALQSSAPRMQ